jgi:hypothetical protein
MDKIDPTITKGVYKIELKEIEKIKKDAEIGLNRQLRQYASNYISQFLKIISQKNLSPPFFVSYAFINSLWNIAFSPFGFTNRLGIAISCALVISYSKEMSILHHKTLTTGAINS